LPGESGRVAFHQDRSFPKQRKTSSGAGPVPKAIIAKVCFQGHANGSSWRKAPQQGRAAAAWGHQNYPFLVNHIGRICDLCDTGAR
jgi:hypothetical protein